MTERIESNSTKDINKSTFTLQDFIQLILGNWYWFIISLGICGMVAMLYLCYTPPTYLRTATVLVKDSRKGSSSEVTAFNDIIGGMGRRSVDNEIHIFKSRHLMEEVVTQYDLATRYTKKVGLRITDIYGHEPVIVKFLSSPSKTESFKYSIEDNGNIKFYGFTNNEEFITTASIGDTISLPIGDVTTIATPHLNSYDNSEICVTRYPLNEIIESYRKRLKCEISDKQASIISITFADEVPQRAENIINGIITAYDRDAIEDKQSVSNLTQLFIEERLTILGDELDIADGDIAAFKQEHRMYSPADEAQHSAEQVRQLNESELSLEANLEMANYILNYLTDDAKDNALIPASTVTMSGASSALATQIDLYNTSVLDYERLVAASSESNPTVVDLSNQITQLREAVITSLESHIEGIRLQIEQINREQSLADRRMQDSPAKEKELLSKTRQQKVKEELYIYLLTKLEENALMGATAESNARVIDQAYGSNKPISPNSTIIALIAILMGLALPMALLYIRETMNTAVRSRRDLDEVLTIPFLGDIPEYKGDTSSGIVISENGRDALSESFRMIRANLGFMSVDKPVQVIMLTSSIPHSGKSFVSLNLAMALATSGKRVVVIDLDLRRRTLSKTMGHRTDRRGVTSYLTGKIAQLNDVISGSALNDNLDFVYSGPQPPNPTEILLSERMDQFIAELRTRYDYIIIDSVPAMAVADAMVIDRLVDLTIYIIREGGLDRRLLPDIESLHREKKFHNMCTILNGVTHHKRRYGYGYGYYDESDDQGRWSKIKSLFNRKHNGEE